MILFLLPRGLFFRCTNLLGAALTVMSPGPCVEWTGPGCGGQGGVGLWVQSDRQRAGGYPEHGD